MNKYRPMLILSCALLTGGLLLFFTACEITGGEETVREVSLQISGAYQNTSGIPQRQSGQPTTLISLNQSGDQLEGVDNVGLRWSGTIGRAEGNTATITLKGSTSAGAAVVFTGIIVINGTSATLSGTWIEPAHTAAASAQASVSAQPTATPVSSPTPGATATPTVTVTLTPTTTATPTTPPTP